MTKTLAQTTKDYLLNRQWTHSVAVTLNMKHAIKDPSGTWIRLEEYRINQNFRHFLNLLNARCFGPNWRRKNKRLHVFPVWEKAERHHIHTRINNPNLPFESFKQLIFECWEKTDFAYGSNLVVANCDDGWISYQAKKTTKQNYDLSFLWEKHISTKSGVVEHSFSE